MDVGSAAARLKAHQRGRLARNAAALHWQAGGIAPKGRRPPSTAGSRLPMSTPLRHYLDFERPVAEIESKLDDLAKLSASHEPGVFDAEIEALRGRAERFRRDVYARLDPWQKTQVARHPDRPHFGDYLRGLIEDFVELRGDRVFGDDQAVVGGLGRFRGNRGRGARPREGPRHRNAAQAQLRHGPARGLPQGGAPDGHGRAVRPAGADLRGHRRRLSRAWGRRSAGRARPSPAPPSGG